MDMQAKLLDGKVALVTGGGSGIGRAVATGFAGAGAKVVLCGRREGPGEETAEQIRRDGGEALFVKADVTRAEDVEHLVDKVVSTHGRLDVAFNNAGVFEGLGPLADLTEEDYQKSFDGNVRSVFLCLKYEIRQMLKQGGGTIINNASAQSHLALGYSAHYTACKHAILGYTRAAAVDYAKDNIRVNAISPGIVVTSMLAGFDPETPETKQMLTRIPIGRAAVPEEMVGTVVFMASDMSPYMHGAALNIDGGWTAH
jgi:NAD(P)-dependent dehydrogenase (short-subunit alcohol dehydrogenase family)